MATYAQSRVQRRSGTKSNACHACGMSSKNGKINRKFKGAGRARLLRHIEEVHNNRREIRRDK